MKIFKLLKTINLLLTVLITVLIAYIIFLPFVPEIVFATNSNEFEGYAYQSPQSIKDLNEKAKELPLIPDENRIVLPRIYVNAPIVEGNDDSILDLGMWHRPNTSTPDKGGNTVIAGHRFLYTKGPDTLYHLNKMAVNDLILVYWHGKEYVYKVYEITQVDPDQIDIEYNTEDSMITLYTCTPVWTSENRLVVKAKLQ